MKPQYSHDCPDCKFLGRSSDGKQDLYFCPKGMTTLISRYGNGGPRYVSGIAFADTISELGEAKKLAIAAGLMKESPKTPDGDFVYALYECTYDDSESLVREVVAVSPSLSKIQQWAAENKPEYALDKPWPGDEDLIYEKGDDYLICSLKKKIQLL